ncbi:MAG: hypothetical protein ACFE8U_16445 [Candidatus Hermodarchaeota archaeon]
MKEKLKEDLVQRYFDGKRTYQTMLNDFIFMKLGYQQKTNNIIMLESDLE